MNTFQLLPDGFLFPFPDGDAVSMEQELRHGILRELLDNGLARQTEEGVHLAYEQAAALYEEKPPVLSPDEEDPEISAREMMMLGFPEPYPFILRVEADGDLQDADLQFKGGFYAHYHGEKLDLERRGCLLLENGEPRYALPLNLYTICERLDAFNATDTGKNLAANLCKLKELQDLASQGGVKLEPLLADNIVKVPQQLGIRMEKAEEGIRVKADLPGLDVDAERFAKEVKSSRKARDTYNETLPDGKSRRVVFTEEQKAEIAKIKKSAYISSRHVDNFIAHPEEYFDPDLVDLDSFSERVQEIGYYKPRYYPFITPYKSEWFEGLLVEETLDEQKKVVIRSEESLESLDEAIRKAEKGEEDHVVIDDVKVPLEQARELAVRSRKRLQNPAGPGKDSPSDTGGEARGEKVLIIYENVDELDFAPKAPAAAELEHVYEAPPNLASGVALLEHQREGVAWLQELSRIHEKTSVGALLADDMGLGKTLQVLAFIEWHNASRNRVGKPYLVVAPVALLENWEAEYRKFFPDGDLAVQALYGSLGREMLPKGEGGNCPRLPKAIYLTTYETLRKRQRSFCAVDWAAAILDEAQKIKTPGTLVTNAAKALKADLRVAATGTPVENGLTDLWCLTDFVMPGLLGSAREFNKQYRDVSQDPDADIHSLTEEIRGRLGCFIKRRLKEDILTGLPPKHVTMHPRPMPPYQCRVYQETVDRLAEDRKDEGSGKNLVLSTLLRLRDISDHPYLAEKGDDVFDNYSCRDLIDVSAKLATTVELLRKIRQTGEKVIIFAIRRPVQHLLKRILVEELGLPPGGISVINGTTPAGASMARQGELSRQGAVDLFQSRPGFQAIVISPLAAGFGLNIAGANHVIHYSRHWNPAKEAQATDRAHRIGQKKDVFVYYPLATGEGFRSFDEILNERLQMKSDLARETLFPTDQMEVKIADILQDLDGQSSGRAGQPREITLKRADEMDPYDFEALIAALWARQGYHTTLTPKSSDRGADVVVQGEGRGFLFQVKRTSGNVGDAAVGEILKAVGYYREGFGMGLMPAIITNGGYTQQAREVAGKNSVRLFGREDLQNALEAYPVTRADLDRQEARRMERC